MIKTALKHYLYEKCIDVIFDNIKRNFTVTNKIKFKIGDRYKRISWGGNDFYVEFFNCLISDIEVSYSKDIIGIKFTKEKEYVNGVLIDEWEDITSESYVRTIQDDIREVIP